MSESKYKRILLKLSGEALMGEENYGIDPNVIKRLATEIKEVRDLGVQIGVVIGGGNIFRGAGLAESGIDRVAGDHMGMLATVMNSIALQNSLEQLGVFTRVMSAIKINRVCEDYLQRRAVRHLEKGRVVVFAAGTGNPFFTTDSAASLRSIEIKADLMLKSTKVDGVYSADPVKDPSAVKYDRLTYDEVLQKKLMVMDATAIVMCRDQNMPLQIFDGTVPGGLMKIMQGEQVGTIVETE